MMDSMIEFTTAHEVAHQYWPGLVGSDSRKHPWLDESLAQWSAVLYFADRYGEKRAFEEADRQVGANYSMMRLLGVEDAAVDRPVEAFENELGYAGLVYGKGPYFFREAKKKLGDEAFFASFRRYVEKNRFQSVGGRNLVDELAQGEHADEVRTLAKRWLDEMHGDEDLGKPDIRKLMATWVGEDAAKNMGPELEMAMKLVLKLMAPGGKGSSDSGDLLDMLLKGASP
jgi:hypothetical protein